MKHVGVNIVTGFLGAGKTTLLSHALLGPLARSDVVFVVNEIGEIGLDGRVLTGFAGVERVVELANGCICCSIQDARFDVAIRELVDRYDPALVVIETTGLADPFALEARVTTSGLGLDGVITVVDAEAFELTARQTSIVRRQVAAADFLVLNKVDRCDERGLARIRRRLARLNRRACLVEATRGRVDASLLFGLGVRAYRVASAKERETASSHLAVDGVGAFSWRGDRLLDRKRFEGFLRGLPGAVYRAKGIVGFSDTPWRCLFNYTCGRYEMNWIQWQGAPAGVEAVFIGKDIAGIKPALVERLVQCEAR